ncbi:MAG TPA: TasA family protein [Candidatus Limnocylindria bacterium]|nr:TasA family protein [Candidatus Limnocylindria bacterium]
MNAIAASAADPRDASRRRRRLLMLLMAVLAVLSVGAGQLSLALFTDQETVNGTFTSGTIDLDGTAIDALTLTTSALMPGDTVTDDVLVSNIGTAQLRYALSTSSTNADAKDLRGVLTLTVKTIDVTTPGVPCDNFDGTSVLAATVLGASTAGFGSSAAGAQAGDRTLNAAASETLCFRISLPSGTGNAYQGATTTTTFTFDAEQTASNP